jgi:hypothetical protein
VVTAAIKSRASQPRTHVYFTQVPSSRTKSFSTLRDKTRRAGPSLLANSKRLTALRHSSNRLSESPRSAAAAKKTTLKVRHLSQFPCNRSYHIFYPSGVICYTHAATSFSRPKLRRAVYTAQSRFHQTTDSLRSSLRASRREMQLRVPMSQICTTIFISLTVSHVASARSGPSEDPLLACAISSARPYPSTCSSPTSFPLSGDADTPCRGILLARHFPHSM